MSKVDILDEPMSDQEVVEILRRKAALNNSLSRSNQALWKAAELIERYVLGGKEYHPSVNEAIRLKNQAQGFMLQLQEIESIAQFTIWKLEQLRKEQGDDTPNSTATP